MAGQLIRMFLADGDENGIKTLEISNKTIYCTIFPRLRFDQFKIRKEYNRPGVYFLLGKDENTDSSKIYIGEGDPVGNRLTSHFGTKDFWTDAIAFTSKDDYLTKTQIQYLESCLIKEARKCGQAVLDNSNMPQLPNISEAETAEVSGFLESIYLLMVALGYNLFQPMTVNSEDASSNQDYITFEAKNTKKNALGKLQIRNGSYVLLKGSQIAKEENNSAEEWLKGARRKLLENNLLEDTPSNYWILKADTEYKSASTAAAVVLGGNMNGLREWKHGSMTLGEYETQNARN